MKIRVDSCRYKARRISEDLVKRIKTGEFKSGSTLPSTKKLCEEYGATTNTLVIVREILVKLGLVEVQVRASRNREAGTYVL